MQLLDGKVGPDRFELLSEFVTLVCITVMATAFGDKSYCESFKTINYGRVLVLLLYFFSWAFSFTSITLVSTNNRNITSCTLSMLSCDIFYGISKVIGYAWFMERVYLATNTTTKRMESHTYRCHLLLLCPYFIIGTLMLIFQNISLTEDGRCTIGLQLIASIPLMLYDFFLNLYLTLLFVRPLMNLSMVHSPTDWRKSRLYRLARRTMIASVVCLLVSFFNVLTIVITQGHERGLICLTTCAIDLTVNVMAVHWVTNNSKTKNKEKGRTITPVMKTGDSITTANPVSEGQDTSVIHKPTMLAHLQEQQDTTKE